MSPMPLRTKDQRTEEDILVTTAPTIDGKKCTPIAIITGLDIDASYRPVSFVQDANILASAKQLQKKALAMGADAVIGVQHTLSVAPSIGIYMVAIGTAVRFE